MVSGLKRFPVFRTPPGDSSMHHTALTTQPAL